MNNVLFVPFDEAYLNVPVGKLKIQQSEYLPSGRFVVVDQGQNIISGYSNNDEFLRKDPPYILFGDHTKMVKFIDVPFIVGADGVRLYKACKGFNTEYLYFYLRSLKFPDDGYGRHSKYLSDKLVPKPNYEYQCLIASKLKAQQSEVEKARKALAEQLKETQNLANALIYKSIKEGKSQNLKLGDVLFEIKKGIGENWQDFPVLGATRNGLALAKEPPGKMPQRYKPVFSGTVFYNPMRILIGSIAFVDDDDQRGITSPDYVVLKGKEGMLDSRWFYYWLRSPLGEYCIKSLARGAVRERMLFNRLAEGEIELPEFAFQQKTSDSLKELKHVILHINKELDALDSIPGKLLEKAFKTE